MIRKGGCRVITHILRLMLARQLGPFSLQQSSGFLPSYDVPNFGLYVHVPFCRTFCDFCPYYKIRARPESIEAFRTALVAEIELAGSRLGARDSRSAVSSLYLGGGSPATLIADLPAIRRAIDGVLPVAGHCGIELHPRDVGQETARRLLDAGFDMVSLGVQSFSTALQENLGRESSDGARALHRLSSAGFPTIDVDLIFAIPGQGEDDLCNDFRRAVELGATQVSTYPFIEFSYANNPRRPLSHGKKRRMLDALLATADELQFERTSVWTFAKRGSTRYSSVTRDFFLGFGPSAASLGRDAFKVNTFSVSSYVQAVKSGRIPTAVALQFAPRTRRLYWIFWNVYNGFLSRATYRGLFGSELRDDFASAIALAERSGLLQAADDGWRVTSRGSRLFHRIEQVYTHQYIDKTWRASMTNPWPEAIDLY